jgi:hypothetical protein
MAALLVSPFLSSPIAWWKKKLLLLLNLFYA